MITIHKYPVSPGPNNVMAPPLSRFLPARFLSVQEQNEVIYVWALVDDALEKVKHEVLLHPTGGNLAEAVMTNVHFIGTVQQGRYVWHAFFKET